MRRFQRGILGIVLCWALVATAEQPPKQAYVSSAHPLASAAGIEILKQGGNAMDAAIAVTAALAVVEPYGSGLGGGGFYLLRSADKKTNYQFLDARERAPLAAHDDLYRVDGAVDPKLSLDGALAAAIPGIPAALEALNTQHAKLSLADNLAPAIALARDGFTIDAVYQERAGWRLAALQKDPESARIFLDQQQIPEQGWILRQPELANTLSMLAEHGSKSFYQGTFAQKLVNSVQDAGGIWSLEDLAHYRVQWRKPLIVPLAEQRQLITAPPPSAGGIAIAQSLLMLQRLPWQQATPAQRAHYLAEVFRRAYRDRSLLGDPDFVDNPTEALLARQHIVQMANSIQVDQATPSASLAPGSELHEGDHTTHFAVLDQQGNAVAATLSLNMMFGAAFTVPGTGVLLNDEMDDFAADLEGSNAYGLTGSVANQIQAGKRPLSSMSPSFLEGPSEFSAFGTPGGSRIPSMNVLAMLEHLDGKAPAQWVASPRIHHQYLPDVLGFEPGALTQQQQQRLEKQGHQVKELTRNYGNQQVLWWQKDSGHSAAASDPRGHGASLSH
ncbi:MAG TPA: gamma-glutamyltransferase [Gammaproteobacteria bacterium]|nr:gamma-glutamyltransferase [Gammaproteobacteria bacterium]